MEIPSGSRIAHYEIISPIGAGGMGEVYLAQDTRLGRKIALKILSAEFTKDDDRVRRFQQEARAASALNHPNILTIHDIGQADSIHYIATEFIDGQTLRKYLTNKPLSTHEVLDIGIQVASALTEAHASGIVHRDIKPENIMLRQNGLVKVLDFGLAKLIEKSPLTQSSSSNSEAATVARVNTDPGTVMGTVSYMSPEQARGLKVDARTDIFSLGVVVYEALTGKAPFTGATPSDIIASILRSDPSPLTEQIGDVPEELQRIISKSLEKDRDERYQSVKDLQIDLKRLKQQLELQPIDRAPLKRELGQQSSVQSIKTDEDTVRLSVDQEAVRVTSSLDYFVGRIRRNKLATLIAFLVFAAVALVVARYYYAGSSNVPIDSIAVLPFVNQNSDQDTEYLSDGFTESTINSLAHLQNLKVIARSSVFHYKGRNVDPMTAGHELSVRAVLTGRIIQHGDSLIISADLMDVRDNKQIWGERYERKTSDLLTVQREVARDISNNLQMRLSNADRNRVTKHYTDNEEAYQLYLKGRFYWNKRTGDATTKSLDYFHQAIDKDPNFALAYAGLADAYLFVPIYSAGSPQEYYPMAKKAAMKALELDDSLAEAHTSLALVLSVNDFNILESNKEFERAIELNPNYAPARQLYSDSNLLIVRQFDRAVAEARKAVELDPLSSNINADLGEVYLWARQYDKAIEQIRKTMELDPGLYFAHYNLGIAYELKGMYSEARQEYEKARQLSDDPFAIVELARLNAKTGRKDEALRMLDQLKQLSQGRYFLAYFVATVYAALGDRDKVFEWLENSYQSPNHGVMGFMDIDPAFDAYHSDPHFVDLIHRMGLDRYR
ncbi:MAG TPA: protein kinase [Blastocatellia bacterium]|nr:protein kinase [Blastocatellia bacterium]